MRELSRRKILQGIASVPILPVLHSIAKHEPSRLQATASGQAKKDEHSQILAVVFHGLFAFLIGGQGDPIDVVVPKVKGHFYWAGNFGQEDQNVLQRTEPSNFYNLYGLKPGSWSPSLPLSCPYHTGLSAPDESKLQCRISIPWPDDLQFGRMVPPKKDIPFFTSPAEMTHTEYLPTIYVFVYWDSTITARPFLSGTNWIGPRSMGSSGNGRANLHIRAEHCRSGVVDGWSTFNSLFSLNSDDKIQLDSKTYGLVDPDGPNGIGGIINAGEDNFLHEEPECKMSTKGGSMVKDNSLITAVNCASMVGTPPGFESRKKR